jgi:hypothetical protein
MKENPMPDPKDNAKLTGDSHPPELEDMEQAKTRPRNKPEAQGAHGGTTRESSVSSDLEAEGGAADQAGGTRKEKGAGGKGGGS